MPKTDDDLATEVEAAPEPLTPVKDGLDTSGGPQFVHDQMADALERAMIEARGRTHDLSIRWGHDIEADREEMAEGDDVWVARFWVAHGAERRGGLTVDEAKAALDAIGVVAP